MHDIKKRKSIVFCFYFLAATALATGGCGKKEEVPLSEISVQNTDSDDLGSEKSDPSEEETVSESVSDENDTEADFVYVYVCGRVNQPGVYRLKTGSRICDGIEAAGGMLEDGATDYLNQAELLEDGERVYVPSMKEAEEMMSGEGLSQGTVNAVSTASDSSGKISINSAGKEELMTLTGIGSSKAEAIIRYREENGGFATLEELMQVEGIKEGTFEKIKNDITL